MTTVLYTFGVQFALILLYFGTFINADHRCYVCPFDPNIKKRLTVNDTIHPRGCLSLPAEKLYIQKSLNAKTCTWEIVLESFEAFENVPEANNKPATKKWRLLPAGLVSVLNFDKKSKADVCEKLEVSYSKTAEGTKQKVFKCYCGLEFCNKNYPLCKWLRAADPSLTDPVGCVEDDIFPSEKEPNLYKGEIYKRLEGQEAPTSKPVQNADEPPQPKPITTEKPKDSKSSGSRTCADEINDIYNGIKDIQQLLKDEL